MISLYIIARLHTVQEEKHSWSIIVEPLNNGYVGTRHFVVYREVVLSSEVKNVLVL